ncbi:hypothetical protein SNEBB_002435 [Seison nebaliae]|nr:hypothetical protein SNEBB_002435 [Seison nebaliae]
MNCRSVRIFRDSLNSSWGLRIHGGRDYYCPLSIQRVQPGSPAASVGLEKGDHIIKIGETETQNLTHVEALELIRNSGGSLELLVKKVNMQPLPTSPHGVPELDLHNNTDANVLPYLTHTDCLVRSRPLDNIPEPKSFLSQTGSPCMPGIPIRTPGPTKYNLYQPNHRNANQDSVYITGGPERLRVHTTDDAYLPAWKRSLKSTFAANRLYADEQHRTPSGRRLIRFDGNVQPGPIRQRSNTVQMNPGMKRDETLHLPDGRSVQNHQYNSPLALYSNDAIDREFKGRKCGNISTFNAANAPDGYMQTVGDSAGATDF